MTDGSEPEIRVATREDIIYLLAEAAEIEHNLMCCYLYAVFSLKRSVGEDLTEDEVKVLARWRGAILSVAIEEMTHLTLVSNLMCALGGRPQFQRPNFPVPAGYHPADMIVRLAPFDMDTLDHFIFLERPEGSATADSAAFAVPSTYKRIAPSRRAMPSSQDYLTVGGLYHGIRNGLDHLAAMIGNGALFCGAPEHQVGPGVAPLPGLCVVDGLASAHSAIDTIVEQGEGAPEHRDDGHFARFCAIKQEYEAVLARNPAFRPARSVATNPVMRKPAIDAENRVYIDEPIAAHAVDLANAMYGQMLRFLVQAFGRANPIASEQSILIDAAIELMQCMASVAEALTKRPASLSQPNVNAGMTFAMLRNLAPPIERPNEWAVVAARVRELAASTATLSKDLPEINGLDVRLLQLATRLDMNKQKHRGNENMTMSGDVAPSSLDPAAESGVEHDVEVAQGRDVTIKFHSKRCIHSRFCVLWQPQVYRANVEGAWLDADADSVEATVAVAHSCPSGAIQYERHDGVANESGPSVNFISIRENGSLAVRAEISLDGQPIGYRATLCRCGASKNKPFCDSSHNAIGFKASGEPQTIDTPELAVRNGPLELLPQRNGPLCVRGNLEICSGTGRTIKRTTGDLLCRCGESQNKPFCDGSHTRVGFVST